MNTIFFRSVCIQISIAYNIRLIHKNIISHIRHFQRWVYYQDDSHNRSHHEQFRDYNMFHLKLNNMYTVL